MMRVLLPFAILLPGAVSLGGCNEMAGGAVAGPVASAPIVASAYQLPADAPCSHEIDTYQAVVAHDLETGNVERGVYDQIESELSRAAHACSAGAGGEAHALVAASKARHGYRA